MYSHSGMLNELRKIADAAEHVRLDREQLGRVAEVTYRRLRVNDFEVRQDFPDLKPADILQYYLIAGAHNFLIWQRDEAGRAVPWHIHIDAELRYGAPAIYDCHLRALRRGMNILDPNHLASMTLADMEDYYRDDRTGKVTLQFISERLGKFKEIGRVLKQKYRGSFLTLLEQAEGYLFRDDGQGIIQQLLNEFPLSYGDWPFCKLTMVTLGNLYKDRDQLFPKGSKYRHFIDLRDPEKLEVGADYYRPFFFYRVGVLRVSPTLKKHLVNQVLIERDSLIEREYRAWTILAARALSNQLGVTPHEVARKTWAMGFMSCRLCYIGVSEDKVPCSYRPFCHSYNHEPSLMKGVWPLVLTSSY